MRITARVRSTRTDTEVLGGDEPAAAREQCSVCKKWKTVSDFNYEEAAKPASNDAAMIRCPLRATHSSRSHS